MRDRASPLQIVQVNSSDIGGGAEKVALDLFQAYRKRGLGSHFVVGKKFSNDPDVLLLASNAYRSRWARLCGDAGSSLLPIVGKMLDVSNARSLVQFLGEPRRFWKIRCGQEDFDFPGTCRLLELTPKRPDIIHCHNLHGGYFDLKALSWLSQQVTTLLTLHDSWLLSGHCAHSFGCERWKIGCGQCPDLTIYPAIRQDATAFNWKRKRNIYAQSRLYVATPSSWLMQMVEQSMLAPSITENRVIPNGVDLTVFHPGEQHRVREILGIRQDVKVLLFVGNATRSNRWRDYCSLEAAVRLVAHRLQNERLILICLGEAGRHERIGSAEAWFVGYQKDPATVVRYYQAADIYVHPAIVDTFPNTVLEALACGIPVVATAVGGIPEQVKGLYIDDSLAQLSDANLYESEEATGALVPSKNVQVMATAIEILLRREALRVQLGENASQDARQRFDLELQVKKYLEWYDEIRGKKVRGSSSSRLPDLTRTKFSRMLNYST